MRLAASERPCGGCSNAIDRELGERRIAESERCSVRSTVACRIPQKARNRGANGRRETKVYTNFIYCRRNACLPLMNVL